MDWRTVLAKVAGQASSVVVPLSGPATEAILSDLLGVQNEQLAILKKLEVSVQRLADVPWGSALIYIEDAAIPGRRPEQVRLSLERAADKLHDAIPSRTEESPSRADNRLVFVLLSDHPASQYHAQIAYREARTAAWWLVNNRERLDHSRRVERNSTVSAWYDDVEWGAALLGDPKALPSWPSSKFSPSGGPSPFKKIMQWPDDQLRVRWRAGAPLDFLYVIYAQEVRLRRGHASSEQFSGRSLTEVLNDVHEPLPSRLEFGIEEEQRMGYFTGMEE